MCVGLVFIPSMKRYEKAFCYYCLTCAVELRSVLLNEKSAINALLESSYQLQTGNLKEENHKLVPSVVTSSFSQEAHPVITVCWKYCSFIMSLHNILPALSDVN